MATKKKTKKTSKKASKKSKRTSSPAGRGKVSKKSKPAAKVAKAKRKRPAPRKAAPIKKKAAPKRTRTTRATIALDQAEPESRLRPSARSGDLQGLSHTERADSESVDELLEEGNAFEAGVVSGVEEADDLDEREVHTRQVPEDDVPDEYLGEE